MRTPQEAKDSIQSTQAALARLAIHVEELRLSIAHDRMDSALSDSIRMIRDADQFLNEAVEYADSVIAKQLKQARAL